MRLLALTPAEIAFLDAPLCAADDLQARLTRRLAATLRARLRIPLAVEAHPADVLPAAPERPLWQLDAALASLWLTRRLGGQRVAETASFVSPSLLRTLDAALAECWLDDPAQTIQPALAWHLSSELAPARFAVQLPQHSSDMTRWAREIIRHG